MLQLTNDLKSLMRLLKGISSLDMLGQLLTLISCLGECF
jgi:hypothetical protein